MSSISGDTQTADELLPIGKAAIVLGVSVDTVRRWEREGRMPVATRTAGGQRRFRRGDLEAQRAGVEG